MDHAYIDCECIFVYEVKMISKTLMAASTRPMILAILSGGEDYGYSIIQKVKQITDGNLEWTDGMLYPVLQRMEMDGHIKSGWKLGNGKRPRRYYTITDHGCSELKNELTGWKNVWEALKLLSKSFPAGEYS